MAVSTAKVWSTGDASLARLFGITLDVQVLMGAALFLFLSPLTTVVPSATTTALPEDSQAYFFTVVHPVIMVVAFIAVHIAPVSVRRGRSDHARARRALIFYGITWLLVFAGTPWWRPWVRV